MKKLVAILLSVCMVFATAGCASTPASSGAASTPAGSNAASTPASDANVGTQPVEITFWHVMGGVNGEILDGIAKDFNETVGKEKGIVVNSVYQGDDMAAVLKPVIQAGDVKNMPDIANVTATDTTYMRDLSYLVWLEDLMAKDSSFSRDDFFPNAAETFTSNGRMMAAPFSISAILLYYNKDMFKKAGIDPEAAPKTIAQLAEYTQKLTVRNGDKVEIYGFACTPDRWHVANWIGGQGAYSFVGNNDSGRKGPMSELIFDKEGTMQKLLTEYKKIVDTKGLQNAAADQRNEFLAGQYGMIVQSSSRIRQFLDSSAGKFELGVAEFPKVNADDKGGVAAGGAGLYILNRNDEAKINASYEFVKYCVSPEVQFKWSSSTGYIPVNNATYELDNWKKYVAETPEAMIPVNSLRNSSPNVQEPMDPNPGELGTIFKECFNELVEGKTTVEQTVENMVKRGNDSMNLYYQANPGILK